MPSFAAKQCAGRRDTAKAENVADCQLLTAPGHNVAGDICLLNSKHSRRLLVQHTVQFKSSCRPHIFKDVCATCFFSVYEPMYACIGILSKISCLSCCRWKDGELMPLSMARRRPKPLAGLAAHSAEVLMLEASELYGTSPLVSAKFRFTSSVKSRIASATYPLLTTVLAVAQLEFLPWPRLLRRVCETLPGHSWRLILWGSRWAC